MIEHLNKQNKKHVALNGSYDELNRFDCMNWLELMVIQRPDRLNKRLSKLAPRRSKKSIDHILQYAQSEEEVAEVIEDMREMFED